MVFIVRNTKKIYVVFLIIGFLQTTFLLSTTGHLNITQKIDDTIACIGCFDSKRYENACTLIQELVEELCPQQKRVELLKKRVAQAQQEAMLRIKNNQEQPFLSFIIPCYNRAQVIHDVVESIYNQNLTVPFEVIAVDDASQDGSLAVLKAYEAKYTNFFVYRNPVNKKAPTTRNNAIAYARGNYICNADSDDIFEPNTIQPILKAMIQGNYEVAFFQDLKFFNDANKKSVQIVSSFVTNNQLMLGSFLRENYIAPCAGNRIFTKDSWLHAGGYLEDVGHDSWSFSFKLLASGYTAYIHPGSGYLHRLWSNKANMWWDDYKAKATSVSPLRVICENPEFFSKKSVAHIKNYNLLEQDLIGFIKGHLSTGRISLIPHHQLEPLLQAYFYENKGDYTQSLSYFQKAIDNGLAHIIVYIRAARVALRADCDKNMVVSLLTKAKELVE